MSGPAKTTEPEFLEAKGTGRIGRMAVMTEQKGKDIWVIDLYLFQQS